MQWRRSSEMESSAVGHRQLGVFCGAIPGEDTDTIRSSRSTATARGLTPPKQERVLDGAHSSDKRSVVGASTLRAGTVKLERVPQSTARTRNEPKPAPG